MSTKSGEYRGVGYTLARRAGSRRGTWQLRYSHPRAPGGRVRETTRTDSLDEAHAYARSHIARLLDSGGSKPWTLAEAIDTTFALRWAGKRSEATLRLNTELLKRYFGADLPVDRIGLEEYAGFVRWMQERGASDATINKKTSNLRVILGVASEAGRLGRAVPKLPHRKEGRGRVRYISDDEERSLLALLDRWNHPELVDYLTFMIDTGLRRGEALALEWRDVDLDHRRIHLWETKTSTPRTVPLTLRAADAVERRRGTPEGRVFGLTPENIRHWWDRAAVALRLDQDPQWVPYITRHTCASRLVMAGFHLRRVMEWMGHKNITTTLRYAHLSTEALDDGARLLDERAPAPRVHLRRVK